MTTDHKPLDGEVERDAKDFAVEFGESMAKAAQRYMEVSAERIRDPDELSDTFRALGSAIHEFRKRAARARSTQKEATEDARDAARYRYLRERDLDTIKKGGVFAGQTPENFILNGDDLDAAIDAAKAGLRIVKEATG